MTWAPVSELGFSNTGFISVWGGDPAGHGLNRLGAADFTTIHGDRRIQRHVLRLERRHADTASRQHPAQTSHQRALAGVRCGSLNHQCWCRHGACPRLPSSQSSQQHQGCGEGSGQPCKRPCTALRDTADRTTQAGFRARERDFHPRSNAFPCRIRHSGDLLLLASLTVAGAAPGLHRLPVSSWLQMEPRIPRSKI